MHGEILLTGRQLPWGEKARDLLASAFVDLYRPFLGLPDGYKSEVANMFGRAGMAEEEVCGVVQNKKG